MIPAQIEIPKWSAGEFQSRVLNLKPKVAVFDCDGTLWSGDSGYGFMVWSLEQGLVSRSTSDWIDNRHRAYRAGTVSELQICGEMVQIYAGLREQELRAAAAQYVRGICAGRGSLPNWLNSLQRSRSARHGIVGRQFHQQVGGRRGCAAASESRRTRAGRRSQGGRRSYQQRNRGCADRRRQGRALRRAGLARPDAVFGNSIHDLAMLEIAANAFPVNPSPALLEAASRHGWGYFRPAAAEGIEARWTENERDLAAFDRSPAEVRVFMWSR